MIEFSVKAYDEKDKIVSGTHQRAIIESERFLKSLWKNRKIIRANEGRQYIFDVYLSAFS